MEKQEIISFIESQIAEGKISKQELFSALSIDKKTETSKNLINIFYIIGAIIALVGIIILIVQNWSDIGLVGRILVTLGISLSTYVAGYLIKDEERHTLSQVLFTMSAFLAPVGTGVLLHEAKIEVTPLLVSAISLVWAVMYGSALWGTRKSILIIFTTAFATVSLYSLASELFSNLFYSNDLFKLLTIFVGVAYVLMAYSLSEVGSHERRSVKNILYGLGTIAILGVGISFGGFIDLLMIAVIFGAFYASVYIKSTVVLMLSALFLIAHIINITGEYFADSMNWAMVLIFVGFLIIGIGYATFYLNKKYISNNQSN